MPLPERRPDESHDEFISRCMGDKTMVREFPSADQRRAVCETQWRRTSRTEGRSTRSLFLRASVNVEAQASDDPAGTRRPRLSMVAYTGGVMDVAFWGPVLIDLAGLDIPDRIRVLADHQPRMASVVGVGEAAVVDGALYVEGEVTQATAVGQLLVALAKDGVPLEASVGIQSTRWEKVRPGRTVRVNGRTFQAGREGLTLVRTGVLQEVSVVVFGADSDTSVSVAAARGKEDRTMTFEQWLEARGLKGADLTDEKRESLRAAFEAELKANENDDEASGGDTDGNAKDGTDREIGAPDPVRDLRASAAAEVRRIAAVRRICNGKHPDIEAKAIEEGWDEVRTELEVLRASRPAAPAIHGGRQPVDNRVLEAAVCLSAGLNEENLARDFGERTMEAARPIRNIGLRELAAEAARLEGHDVPRVFGDGRETIQAAFSTMSLPGIIESVTQRTLLESYEAADIVALRLCRISSVRDFKQVTRYRLLGTGGFEKVAPDGELKHGTLDEQSFTNQADTYGQILMLTRKDIINDDLGAFLDLAREMGRSAAAVIDDLFFSLLLSNPGSFFSAANGNLISTAFGADGAGLTEAVTKFRKFKAGPGSKAKDQKPLNIRPKTLLVPVELEIPAQVLIGSANLMMSGGSSATKAPVKNPHYNKYVVESAPHLSDSYYTGYSTTAFYLFADPAVVPAFEIVFLNGRRQPTVERVTPPADKLGIGFRGYIDLGVKEQDPRGAVKSTGTG